MNKNISQNQKYLSPVGSCDGVQGHGGQLSVVVLGQDQGGGWPHHGGHWSEHGGLHNAQHFDLFFIKYLENNNVIEIRGP